MGTVPLLPNCISAVRPRGPARRGMRAHSPQTISKSKALYGAPNDFFTVRSTTRQSSI